MNQLNLLDAAAPRFDGKTFEPAKDGQRLGCQLAAVREFLLRAHGSWRLLVDIERATGYPQASISARLRDLRKSKFGGYTVERRRRPKSAGGTYEYRIPRANSSEAA